MQDPRAHPRSGIRIRNAPSWLGRRFLLNGQHILHLDRQRVVQEKGDINIPFSFSFGRVGSFYF